MKVIECAQRGLRYASNLERTHHSFYCRRYRTRRGISFGHQHTDQSTAAHAAARAIRNTRGRVVYCIQNCFHELPVNICDEFRRYHEPCTFVRGQGTGRNSRARRDGARKWGSGSAARASPGGWAASGRAARGRTGSCRLSRRERRVNG
eukprot:2575325-Pleurochrysis_carterae.AAC.1